MNDPFTSRPLTNYTEAEITRRIKRQALAIQITLLIQKAKALLRKTQHAS